MFKKNVCPLVTLMGANSAVISEPFLQRVPFLLAAHRGRPADALTVQGCYTV